MSDLRLLVVVPVQGKADLLARTLPALERAVSKIPGTQFVLSDNNGSHFDQSTLRSLAPSAKVIKSCASTVGAVRNDGARHAAGDATYLAFVDCDCVVSDDFCVAIVDTFLTSGAQAVGCAVISPANGHWTETTADILHRSAGDGPRTYLNTGCLAVDRRLFDSLGGFDESLIANEDVDFCERLRHAGGRIWQSERLRTTHLGNPKSIAGYFRRLRWHGMGVVSQSGKISMSPMLLATLVHAVTAPAMLIAAIYLGSEQRYSEALGALLLVSAVPSAFVLARMLQRRRIIPFALAVALMHITFAGRMAGLVAGLSYRRKQHRC